MGRTERTVFTNDSDQASNIIKHLCFSLPPNEEKVGHHLSRGEASKAWILTVWSRYIMNHDIGHWVKTFSSHCHELLKFKVLTAFGHRRMLASAKMQ